jgi:hypothetical protein
MTYFWLRTIVVACWERYNYPGALLAVNILNPDATTVRFNNPSRDRQSHSTS